MKIAQGRDGDDAVDDTEADRFQFRTSTGLLKNQTQGLLSGDVVEKQRDGHVLFDASGLKSCPVDEEIDAGRVAEVIHHVNQLVAFKRDGNRVLKLQGNAAVDFRFATFIA